MLDEELLFENIPGNSRAAIYTYMLEKLADYAELTLDIRRRDSGNAVAGIHKTQVCTALSRAVQPDDQRYLALRLWIEVRVTQRQGFVAA